MSPVSFSVENSTFEAIVMRKFKLLAVITIFLCVVALTHWIHNGRQSYTEPSKYTQPNPPNLLENTVDCGLLTQILPNTWLWTTEEERNYPLAFAISAYESFERLARLLRLIYRKPNIYCIHVDRKATPEFRRRVKHLAKCFGSNLITIPEELSVDVNWGYFTVLQTTLLCAEHLLKQQSVDWRYMLNLNEKEFPLRTNWELVRALKNLNGSNIVEGMNGTRFKDRIPKKTLSFKSGKITGQSAKANRPFSLVPPHADTVEGIQQTASYSTPQSFHTCSKKGYQSACYPALSYVHRSDRSVRHIPFHKPLVGVPLE
ncbi:Core-2/I-Branching enzyme [Opisthorchis viverrini]|uniref:Core-2/I-Branching enzyme n=1 Tax=Opisthorchis viverrini TaxID=6198 RepID=A0A1S8WZ50_OPIVI|nr:Core-2/I-Branching enzyme [Opisthorchis viverrini]